MDVTVKADFLVSLFLFFKFTGISGEACMDKYTKAAEERVVYVCTNSSTSNFLGDVYVDAKRVPLLTTSRCTCKLVFQDNQQNTVDVEISARIKAAIYINITGLGLTFSSENDTPGKKTIATTVQENSIVFTFQRNNEDLEACLRISQKPSNRSLFRVSCFPSNNNSGDILPTNPPVVGPTENGEGQGVGAAVGGSIGGAAALILGVGLAIIIIRKRRNTSTPNNEEYEVTENPMYHAAKSTSIQQAAEYEVIDTKHIGKDRSLYSDKSSGNTNTALRGKPDTPENEYNHLNEASPVFFTGNVYSSTGNVYSSTGNPYSLTGSNQLAGH